MPLFATSAEKKGKKYTRTAQEKDTNTTKKNKSHDRH